MPTVTLELRGDQIGRYTSFSGSGNGIERVVTVNGVEALGTPDQLFTVVVEQVNAGVTEFQNGQFITILDSDDNIVMPRTGVQPDIEQGRGAGDEHLLLAGQPFLIDLGGVPVGPSTITYTEADEIGSPDGDDDGNLDFDDFPCFAPGTLIATPSGQIDIAELHVGDLVKTLDHGSVPITWIGRRELDLTARRIGKPIMIKDGFLDQMSPSADLVVSPDHRILICDPLCDLLFGYKEVLAPAKGLVRLSRIREMSGKKSIEYITLFTSRHEIILANGLAVETLYPGTQALRRIGSLGRAEILSLCPALRNKEASIAYPEARRLLSVQEARALSETMRLRRQVIGGDTSREATSKLRIVK